MKIETIEVSGLKGAINGMRNPLESRGKSDSFRCMNGEPIDKISCDDDYCEDYDYCITCPYSIRGLACENDFFVIGAKDLELAKKLCKAGSDHRKFMRMIHVQADVKAPLYWWKEYDTYKIATTANSCSTMHKIMSKPLSIDDFTPVIFESSTLVMNSIISYINELIQDKDKDTLQARFYDVVSILPSSFYQLRTIDLNYESLTNIYHSRKNHKLSEWHVFCEWIESLPYSELITGGKRWI